ncbi:calcium-binding protein [Sinorhizobium meliloti]|uniref:calcium-binding protein n=1 Tax=Rhizobium meliloti TaxID=382 RepID=UPI000FD492ED|nr:calcium-binding protein [Sinorhizobium meliloti]RVI19982.1 calcium-binding protein [Sinorhizobium meliloti]RVN91508.1 calcium-binding protein [Sinorhizobium meliloti]RVO15021.1 calcium-binding protein [Sinorhizobium meliloti]
MPVIKGNNSNNKLIGESYVLGVTNHIYGYGGNDTLSGGFFADNYIWGGTGNDIIDGGTGINRLYGEDGDDIITVFWSGTDSQLYGGAGNDRLSGGDGGLFFDGGTGIDIMDGGSGADVYIVDNANDQIIEDWVREFDNVPNPTDTVRASTSYSLSYQARIELFETTNAAANSAINLTGNEFSQTIKGNAGSNTLDGKGGNDMLIGGLGADKLIGGLGVDTANYNAASAAVTVNLVSPSTNTGEAAGDTFSSIENISGSRFHDRLIGDNLANLISGGNGDDNIGGAAGRDTLRGDAGNDFLNGGLDADVLSGGSGKDSFVFATLLSSTNVDTVTDFVTVDDTIRLENGIFTKITSTGVLSSAEFVSNTSGLASDRYDRIIYETDTGKLLYDADGNGSGGAVQFAKLNTGLALTAADFFVV